MPAPTYPCSTFAIVEPNAQLGPYLLKPERVSNPSGRFRPSSPLRHEARVESMRHCCGGHRLGQPTTAMLRHCQDGQMRCPSWPSPISRCGHDLDTVKDDEGRRRDLIQSAFVRVFLSRLRQQSQQARVPHAARVSPSGL